MMFKSAAKITLTVQIMAFNNTEIHFHTSENSNYSKLKGRCEAIFQINIANFNNQTDLSQEIKKKKLLCLNFKLLLAIHSGQRQ